MQLRRAALPLSLLALLASAGCVSVGPESSVPAPARGSVPPVDTPDPSGGSHARRLGEVPAELPLPLGDLPEPPPPAPEPRDPPPARKVRPPVERPAQPVKPRRVRPPKPAPPRPPRPASPRLPGGEELCAAAEGTLPPSVVDLCVRQYGG
ncbi:hypothetical protein [Streptomyces sp. RerS4]|uniref:hypothetical protein n=1 Tax=Streptomyces sp. RerS4 TaxID=2942449 RepID=UPI00201C8BA4|nr:hypothetical protein [Streptomyces sp. RerS4]UQW99771.1 hypothetical protein M4D82_03880 [Streptomyces sp. RerS4]